VQEKEGSTEKEQEEVWCGGGGGGSGCALRGVGSSLLPPQWKWCKSTWPTEEANRAHAQVRCRTSQHMWGYCTHTAVSAAFSYTRTQLHPYSAAPSCTPTQLYSHSAALLLSCTATHSYATQLYWRSSTCTYFSVRDWVHPSMEKM